MSYHDRRKNSIRYFALYFKGTVTDIIYNGSQTELEECQMNGGNIPTVS